MAARQRKPRHTAQTVDMLTPSGHAKTAPRHIAATMTARHGWQIIPGTTHPKNNA